MSTKIEWVKNNDGTPGKTWNPITGCSPVSEGCQNCYARRMANRLKGRYGYPKDEPFKVTFHADRLEEPLRWKKPSRIFLCSMGDLFHEAVDPYWRVRIMQVIKKCPHHIFLFLTKRPEIMEDTLLNWFVPNINNFFLGISVENQRTADERIPILLQIPAAKRFISVEPMLGSINIPSKALCPCSCYAGNPRNPHPDCAGQPTIDWVICGGETGPGARPLHPDWVRSLRDQCQAAGVPFFFKKWGDWFLKTQQANFIDRQIDGKKWEEWPNGVMKNYGKEPKIP